MYDSVDRFLIHSQRTEHTWSPDGGFPRHAKSVLKSISRSVQILSNERVIAHTDTDHSIMWHGRDRGQGAWRCVTVT